MPEAPDRRLAGVTLVLIASAAFAVMPSAAVFAFDAGSNPLTVTALRAAIGAALLLPFLAFTGQARLPPPGALLPALGCGIASAVASYGFIGAVAHIPVSLAVLIFFAHPILIAAFWHWRGAERLTRPKLALCFAIMGGLGLALGSDFRTLDPRGLALAALAAAAVTLLIILMASAQKHAASAQVNFWMAAVTFATLGIVATVIGGWRLPEGASGWAGLVVAGLGVTIGLLGFLAAMRLLGAVRATMISNAEPLMGILFAMALHGERLDGWQWAGVAIVVGGLVAFGMAAPARRGDG